MKTPHNNNREDRSPAPHPPVVLIVPVTGYTESLASNLQALLDQNYQSEKLICVTDTESDPAVPVISQLHSQDNRVIHVRAGLAENCCQKNFNLIAGYNYLENFDGILVFCDSGHQAPSDWLENLVFPLISTPEATVSSGYHHVIPQPDSMVAIGRAICVLCLNLVRWLPFAAQPWGGSTALRATDFRTLKIAELWSNTIVDDVVLADHLQKNSKKILIPRNANSNTDLSSTTIKSWCDWLTRQWAYLKFVFPKTWLLLGMGGIVVTMALYISTAILLTFWSGLYSSQLINISLSYTLFFIVFSHAIRRVHPAPGPIYLWYPAFVLAALVAGWCHAKTWFMKKIHWAEITYRVGSHGKVIHLKRTHDSAGCK